MKTQLHLIFQKVLGEKRFTLRVDNPKEDLSKYNLQDAVEEIIASNIFEDMVPISAQIIETSVETVDLAD